MFKDDFDAEPDRSKHVWLTWDELGISTPGWVIGNLDLDWNDADPSWSHEEEAEEEPEEEEVDEQEDLYDDYDGEHGDYPCEE
jgi:hypothetical protein